MSGWMPILACMHEHQSGLHADDLIARITQQATQALLDYQPQAALHAMAHYDALLVAFSGWRTVALSAPVVAKDPCAWFLFRHPSHGWWTAYDTDSTGLHHPFAGRQIHTHLVLPGGLTAGKTEARFLEAVYQRATQPRYRAGTLEPPSGRDRVHARWVLSHFQSETATGYQTLLGLRSNT